MFWGKTAQQLTDIERALLVQEVQRLKMQEDEAAGDAAVAAPKEESGWARFVEGFKEGWNEKVPSNTHDKHFSKKKIQIDLDDEYDCIFPSLCIPEANDYTHPQYEEYWGIPNNRR